MKYKKLKPVNIEKNKVKWKKVLKKKDIPGIKEIILESEYNKPICLQTDNAKEIKQYIVESSILTIEEEIDIVIQESLKEYCFTEKELINGYYSLINSINYYIDILLYFQYCVILDKKDKMIELKEKIENEIRNNSCMFRKSMSEIYNNYRDLLEIL